MLRPGIATCLPLVSALLQLPLLLSAHAEDSSIGQYYLVRVWGADEGLTEGSVTDVAQTPEGYLWVGTLFGSVLRFDGLRFVSYNSVNTPEFQQKWGVPRLMVGAGGRLWISMLDGALISWDRHGFHAAYTSTNQPDRLLWSSAEGAVFVFPDGKLLSGRRSGKLWKWDTVPLAGNLATAQHCADSEGRVWYLRSGRELGVWDGSSAESPLGSKLAGALSGTMAGQKIKILTANQGGHIWIGTDQAIAQWQGDHFEVMSPTNDEQTLDVKRIIPSGNRVLWVEANGRMRCCSDRRWLAESEGWNREMGTINTLRFLHGDAQGGLWSSVSDMGLIHVLPDGTFHRLTTRDGLPSNTINFAYQDRDGNTWTGYERGGLVQVRRRLFQAVGKGEGLNENLINTVCEDSQGTQWIGTHGGAVARCLAGTCSNIVVQTNTRAQDSCVTADDGGRVWIGAQGTGIWLYETGQVRRIVSPRQLQGFTRLMLPSRDGRLWVGTAGSFWSIATVTEDGKLIVRYTAQTTDQHPTSLAQTGNGDIWAGTLAGLLLRWDGEKFAPIEPPDRNSLGRIWALCASPDGSLWAGTEAGGLLRWHDNQFRRYTVRDGLPSDSVAQIIADNYANLWLGTRAGIARITPTAFTRFDHGEVNELPVSVYGQSDGLLTIGSAITFQPNCWRGHDGALYFAMANSVAAVRPDDVRINPTPPIVALEEVRADDQQIWPAREGAILTTVEHSTTDPTPEIVTGPGRGDLEFRFSGLSLGSPSRVRFKYMLGGSERTWNDEGAERKAGYRHLPPGEYIFRVIACNSDGVYCDARDLVKVNLRPHVYQTTWFQTGAGLLLASGLVLGVVVTTRRRMHRRVEQLQRQHELERERTRIAQDLHDDLGAGLTEIGLLGGLLQQSGEMPEQNQQALKRIVKRGNDMVTALDEIVWAVNPRNDSVNSLAGYLSRYAQGFLEPTNIRCRLETREAQPDRPLNSEQRHNLFLAFEEALTNVVRHSKATEVFIRILLDEQSRLLIVIEDNGQGLASATAEGSDGLINLKQRMTRIGAQFEIDNRPGGGVAVRLSLPLVNPSR